MHTFAAQYCPQLADALLVEYYHLVLALIQGSANRPSLPTELALCILQFAQLIAPYPTKQLSSNYTCRRPTPAPLYHGMFRMCKLPLALVPFMRSAPLSADVQRIEVTVRYVGDCTSVSGTLWSDFIIRLVRPSPDGEAIITGPDGSGNKWPCFESSLEAQSGLGTPRQGCERRRTVNWNDLPEMQPGDQLEVVVQTYAGERQIDKIDGSVRVYTLWEPSMVTLGCL